MIQPKYLAVLYLMSEFFLSIGRISHSYFLFYSSAKDCGRPDILAYGHLAKGSDKNYYYPSVVIYVCNNNYVMLESESRSCKKDGKWSGQVPSCLANCGDRGTPRNGKRGENNFFANSVIHFDCNIGFRLSGTKSIQCRQDDARSSSSVPWCESKSNFHLKASTGQALKFFLLHWLSLMNINAYKCILISRIEY